MRRYRLASSIASWSILIVVALVFSLVRAHQAAVLGLATTLCDSIALQSPQSTARTAAVRSGGSIEPTRLGLTVRFERRFTGDVACFIDLEQGKVVGKSVHEFED